MRPRVLLSGVLPLLALSACILSEAQKVDDAAGAGGTGGSTSSQTGPGGGGGGAGGAGGMGGMGGMPPTCTSPDPGATEWVASFGEVDEPLAGAADQRITGLALDPDGIVILGRYTEAMTGAGKAYPSFDGGGHGFLAWLTPEGDYVVEGGQKALVYQGVGLGPPLTRGLAVNGDHVAVVGALDGGLTVGTAMVPAPANRDAFFVEHEAAAITADAYAEIAAGEDQLDDVALGVAGQVFVSGFTTAGVQLPGGDVSPPVGGSVFFASVGAQPWIYPLATGYEKADAIQVVTSADGTLYVATSIKAGSYDVGEPIDVTSNSGVLVARVDPDGTISDAVLFEGGGSDGDQAFVRELAIGPDGRLVVMGSFFGDLVFDASLAHVLTTSSGQTDGFVAVLDPTTLTATHWASFGTSATNETIWAAALDPCGEIVLLGTFRGEMMVGNEPLSPQGPADIFVTKATLEPDGSLAPLWARGFGHPDHVECAAANLQNERNCYRLVATDEGVYVAGAYGGDIDLGDGRPDHIPISGEDSFVMKLAP